MSEIVYFPASNSPERRAPLWARMLGQTYYDTSYRFLWGELSVRHVGFAFKFGCFERPHLNIAVGLFQVFLRLPRKLTPFFDAGKGSIENKAYGFSTCDGDIFLAWGERTKIIRRPWGWRHNFWHYLAVDGVWRNEAENPDSYIRNMKSKTPLPSEGPPAWCAEFPYHYMTDGGDAQHVTATVTRRRRFMSYRVFGVPICKHFREEMDIEFSDEVGNQRGSWKGGCVGCCWEMKPGETVFMALRRMQRERNFCR